MHYRNLFPEYSGDASDGLMDDTWWARYGLEEAAMDGGAVDPMPAHDRLAALVRGQQPPALAEVVARWRARSNTDPTWRGDYT